MIMKNIEYEYLMSYFWYKLYHCDGFPQNKGDSSRKQLQNEEHSKECGCCWHEEQQYREDDCSKEQLFHVVVSTVDPVPQRIVFLTQEQSPQRHQSSVLRHGQSASIGVETVDVDGEDCDEV